MSAGLEQLERHAQQIAERENCFLYDLELVGAGKGRVLRIFIDKDGTEPVTIDDCSRVSQGLNLILDVEDVVPGGSYNLEVSSPGLDRHLRLGWHFEKAIGESINIQLKSGLGQICEGLPEKESKRKKLTGKVLRSEDEKVFVVMATKGEELEVSIPLEQIHKAKVVFDYDKHFNKKKPKK